MNYYNEIKTELIKNEAYKQVKDYSKNRHDLETYYNVGKLLIDAQGGLDRNKYGNSLIKEYSKRLTEELGKGYSWQSLYNMRSYYIIFSNEIFSQAARILPWSLYLELIHLKDYYQILYYIKLSYNLNLSRDDLRKRIKSKEYERLPEGTKQKLINEEPLEATDLVSNPVVINTHNKDLTTFNHRVLEELIQEDLDNFLHQMGEGFMYYGKEYRISDKSLDKDVYIDILLFNYIYNCFVPVELKVDAVKEEDIGQLQVYMNAIDKNLKTPSMNKTVGIIVSKENDRFVVRYCSDDRIKFIEYKLESEVKE